MPRPPCRWRRPSALISVINDSILGKGASGIELLKSLRLRFGDALAAIIVAGSTDPEALAGLRQSGARWTWGPVDANELRRQVATLLGAPACAIGQPAL